ncbi:hypothetical protein GCM10010185_36940 [Saccharothrix coeruleofusca]|uniref:Uncharacterized protein n=1 Tax=Saccharothrix coeruleofusca TaxID=33919 RepID=A0A918AQ49_9PSEU|nr:hypothetical protein GCM10010185_36940 [Saccharothrix coeruleofusca]
METDLPEPRLARVWRGLSGAFAAGLVLLALVMIGVQVYAGTRDLPGPGLDVVLGHVLAAVIAVVAQLLADRRRGWPAAALSLLVVVAGAVALWLFWWA